MSLLVWTVAFLPGIFWLVYLCRQDRDNPEPIWLVALVFGAGALIALPVGLAEKLVSGNLGVNAVENAADAATVGWLVNGFMEEAAKFGVVMGVVYYRSHFDEPLDGIVYAAAAALGFASLENVISIYRMGPAALFIRGPMSTAGHMLFSSIWGYALGKARFDPEGRLSMLSRGFVLAAFFHGLYDFLVFTRLAMAGALYFLSALLWAMLGRMIKDAKSRAPESPAEE